MERRLERSMALIARDEQAITRSQKYRQYPFVVGRSSGSRLWDADGNEYVDFMGVGGAVPLGYGHPALRSAVVEALDREWSAPLVCYAHEPAIVLAERLIELYPGAFAKKAWFGLSGSDAMDFLAKNVPLAGGRSRTISFVGAFHGMTIGSAAISGHAALAKPVAPGHVTKAPYPNPYRCPWGPCSQQECSLSCLRFLEDPILSTISPAGDTAAIFVEPIQSDNGEVFPPDNYLPALRELCDRNGLWLVADEIKTAFGRTGRMFSFEHWGIVPDAVALAKPLAGGLPLSAVVGRAEILDVDVYTAYTLGGSPVSCSAALAVLDVIEAEGLLERSRTVGTYLLERLRGLADDHTLIGDVRGKGLLCGVELVADRATREPASGDALRVAYRCFELGLILLAFGAVLEITPPLVITEDDVDDALAILDRALADVENGRFDDAKIAGWLGEATH